MTIIRSLLLFALAVVAEIGGAWLVWQGVREHRGLAWIGAGVVALGAYGFVATFQPEAHFGRVLAAYGGVFVAGSLAWGMVADGFRPDRWDLAGAAICLLGVAVIMYAPTWRIAAPTLLVEGRYWVAATSLQPRRPALRRPMVLHRVISIDRLAAPSSSGCRASATPRQPYGGLHLVPRYRFTVELHRPTRRTEHWRNAMSWVPDACTLPTEQVPLRVAEFDDLFARALRHLTRPEPTWMQLGLEDSPQVEATVRDLITRETACCSFFDFTIAHDPDGGLRVDVRVPAGREAVLDGLARQATAHAPGGAA